MKPVTYIRKGMPGCEPGGYMAVNLGMQVCDKAEELMAVRTGVTLRELQRPLTTLDNEAGELLFTCQRCENGRVVKPAGSCALNGLTITEELKEAIKASPPAVWS